MGGAGGAGGMSGWSISPATWEYKFVDVKNSRQEYEKVITQNGKDGWEFCSSERFAQDSVVLVFKKPKGGAGFGGFGGGFPGMPGGMGGGWGGWGGWGGAGAVKDKETTAIFALKHLKSVEAAEALNKILSGRGIKVVADPKGNTITVAGDAAAVKQLLGVIEKIINDADAKPGEKPGPGAGPPEGPMGAGAGKGPIGPGAGPPSGLGPMGGFPGGAGPKPIGGLTVLTLKHATTEELSPVLKRVFPGAEITADPRTNQLIIRADAKTLEELEALLNRLDVAVPKGK
jgi:hypothetical protein